MGILLTTLEILGSLALCAIGARFLIQCVITDKLTPSGLRISLFGVLPFYCVFLQGSSVERITCRHCLTRPGAYKWLWIVNRPFSRDYVLIHQKTGMTRYVVISPSDPAMFIDKLVTRGAFRSEHG